MIIIHFRPLSWPLMFAGRVCDVLLTLFSLLSSDMSKRPVCRHFMMKGSCRYESNCAFYHPGVNGPPLPPNHPANNQHNQHPQHGH